MGCNGRLAAKCPELRKVGFNLHELRKRIFKHRLSPLVPLLSACHIAQGEQVGGFAQGGPPAYRVGIFPRTLVRILEQGFRNELVCHGNFKVWHAVGECLKAVGYASHVLVGERQGLENERVALVRCPAVGYFACHHVAFEVECTLDNVGRSAQGGHRRLEIGAWCIRRQGLARSHGGCLAPLHAFAHDVRRCLERIEKTWKLQAYLRAVLVVVDASRGAGIVAASRCPLVGSVQTHVQQFGTAESVALGKTNHEFRTIFSGGPSASVGFYVEVVGTVEKEVQRYVERAAGVRLVAWLERNVRPCKQSRGVQAFHCLGVLGLLVQVAGAELQVVGNHPASQWRVPAVEVKVETTLLAMLVQLFHKGFLQIYRNVSDAPLAQVGRTYRVGKLQPCYSFPMNDGCIGQIACVVVLVIVVAAVAKEGRDALAFLLERGYVERVAVFYGGIGACCPYQTVGIGWEIYILQAVYGPQMSHVHGVFKFYFLLVPLRNQLVCYLPIEVSALVQQSFAHGSVQVWRHVRQGDGARTERSCYPAAKPCGVGREGIPHP